MDELLKALPDLILKVGVPTAMFIAFVGLLLRKMLYTPATMDAKDQYIAFILVQLDNERKQKELAEETAQQTLDTMQEVLRLTHGVVLQAVRDEEPEPRKRARSGPPTPA